MTFQKRSSQYANSNFLGFLTTSVESDAFQVGTTISLGTPFTIISQQTNHDVYYFPILSDGTIVATFRVYKNPETNSFVGIMSKYLADELNSLKANTSSDSPALLFMDENNIMVLLNGKTEVLMQSSENTTPVGRTVSTSEMKIVSPLTPINTTTSNQLVSPATASKYLNLTITETQSDQSWCFAFAAATIIRYVTDSNPQAIDIMELFYSNPQLEDELNYIQVAIAGEHYGLNPIAVSGTINPYSEIDANRPIFLRCEGGTNSRSKSYHGFVLRGYNISSNAYSVWNPWHDYYETMDATTKVYVYRDITYTWINTVYNWV